MHNYRHTEDTICAIATPSGHGGISVVRVSGPRAMEYSKKIISLPSSIESHKVYLSNVRALENSEENTETIDEAVVTYFASGKSFTGEETIEISCHGSPAISERIVQNLILAGCRHAERGEFTFRAFMSGRIDLIQAESILSLIQSDSRKAAEVSLRLLKGELSQKVIKMKEDLTWLLAHLEASIDFSLEDLETIDTDTIKLKVKEIANINRNLLDTYKRGKVLSESLNVVLVGAPNAGKSSLFNQFIQTDKAIVTEIPGTTRDVLESYKIIEGLKVKFIDTAGLHETNDLVEKIGIQKTRDQIANADFIFYVIDSTISKDQTESEILNSEIIEKYKAKTAILVNKMDLVDFNQNFTHEISKKLDNEIFLVSARDYQTLEKPIEFLEGKIKHIFHESDSVVLKARQFELFERIDKCFDRTKNLLSEEASGEFLAFELREALECCYQLLGESLDDKVMEKVFQEFCIGK